MENIEWKNINRDKYGFTTEECLDNMLESLPIIIQDKNGSLEAVNINENLLNAIGYIKINTDYILWRENK